MIDKKYINRKHPLLNLGILSDRGIRKAIQEGKIITGTNLSDDQFQPNSLDLRIYSAAIYHQFENDELPGLNTAIQDPDFEFLRNINHTLPPRIIPEIYLPEYADSFDIPSGIPTTINFAERLETDSKLIKYVQVMLRSGRGRLGLKKIDETVRLNHISEVFMNIINGSPNPIRLYGFDKFAHAFFYTSKKDGDGYVVSKKKELEEIANSLGPTVEVDAPYLVFKAGDFALIPNKTDIVDTREKQDIFQKKTLDQLTVFNNNPHVIVQLSPEVTVPNNVAIQLLPIIPYTNEIYADKKALYTLMHSRVENGPWAESGYHGSLTAHITVMNNHFLIEKNTPLVYALAYKYKEDVLRPYGHSGLNSHYQHSKGDEVKS